MNNKEFLLWQIRDLEWTGVLLLIQNKSIILYKL